MSDSHRAVFRILRMLYVLIPLAGSLLTPPCPAAAQTRSIVLQSGAGSPGSPDPLVWVQGSPGVQPGVPSSGLPRRHPYIVATPPSWGEVTGARWVSPQLDRNGAPGGYEYSLDFELPLDVATATLELTWRGDDRAWPALNGVWLAGPSAFFPTEPPAVLRLEVSALVRGGANRLSLFVQNYDLGIGPNPTGVDFVAVVTFTQRPGAKIILQSGAGSIGSLDPLVWVQGSVQPGVPSSGLPRQHSYVVATSPAWGEVTGARWVSPQPDGNGVPLGYEYLVEFELPPDVATAFLDLTWRADDVAWPALNGVVLPGTAGFKPTEPPGQLHLDVATLIRGGTNRLSFVVQNARLGVNPTGVAFFAVLTTTQGGTPLPLYSITDLGSLGGTASVARFVNATGQVAGFSQIPGDAVQHAFLYDGVLHDLGTLGGTTSQAFGINNSRHVAGWSLLAGDAAQHAFLYRDGTRIDLGTLGGSSSEAFGINAFDQVVGDAYLAGDKAYHAFLYNGAMMDLGTLGGGFSKATSINDRGQVVGWAHTANGKTRAFLSNGGGLIDLGSLGGTVSWADFISASGDIVGFSHIPGDANIHAVLFQNGAVQDLGTLGGVGNSEAFGINQAGQIVGAAITSNNALHAFIYANGTKRDLNALIPPESGWDLLFAFSNNDAGQIVGRGTLNGQGHAYLLTPLPGP